jgi:hypothetical protein
MSKLRNKVLNWLGLSQALDEINDRLGYLNEISAAAHKRIDTQMMCGAHLECRIAGIAEAVSLQQVGISALSAAHAANSQTADKAGRK